MTPRDDGPPSSRFGDVSPNEDELTSTTQFIASAAAFISRRAVEPTSALILVVVIIAVVLVLASPSQAEDASPTMLPPAVAAALADLEAWPEDYGAARRLAEVATNWGAWTMAIRGWTRAEELSGASYETAMGKVVPLLELGRFAEARNSAREATVLAPESGDAWRLLAWSRRQTKAWQTGTYARLGAASAYRTALRVDPGEASAACGLAWTMLGWGDRMGASARFEALLAEDAKDACALSGLEPTAPRWRAGGGFWLSGYAYSQSTNTAGISGLIQGWVSFADLVSLEVTGRVLAIQAGTGTTKVTGTQGEVWARLGVSHAGHGGELLVGFLDRSSRDVTETVVGGRAWATIGATIRAEGAISTFDTGRAALIGAGIRVPVFSLLSLDAGVQFTRWFPSDDDATDVGAMLQGSVLIEPIDGLNIELTGRGGVGWSSIRFDQPAIWNLEERQLGSASLKVSGRLNPWLTLQGGYEAVALGAKTTESSVETSWTHVFTIGVIVEKTGKMER